MLVATLSVLAQPVAGVPAAMASMSGRPTVCGGPLTIVAGGTYEGCHESLDPAVPAVTVATTEPVTISHMVVRHAGNGVFAGQSFANLTVVDSTIEATDPGPPVEQLSIYALEPVALVVEHNQVSYGHGIEINGNDLITSPFQIRFNNFTNIGRYNAPACCAGALHTDKVLAPGGQVQWNRSTATFGRSVMEDAFGFFLTNGGVDNPIDVSHNLVDGVYPFSGDGSSFTGGAFDLGDGGGSWQFGHDNVAVNYTNNGFMIPSGDHITHQNSVAVYDGRAGSRRKGPVVSSPFGVGVTSLHNPAYPQDITNATVTGVRAGHLRFNGGVFERADGVLAPCAGCVYDANTNLDRVDAPAERAAVIEFLASVRAAGVTIGPRR